MRAYPDHHRILLVLGGGALRGLAHIGLFRALEERGVRPDGIIGTSIGACVGSAYAMGRSAADLDAAARALVRKDIVRINRRTLMWLGIRQSALLSGDPLRAFIDEVLGPDASFDDLQIPLRVNAVSLESGVEHWFGTGMRQDLTLGEAVYASSALPLIYPPLEVGEERLVDGAMAENPAISEAFRWGADHILVCDVQADFPPPPDPTLAGGLIEIHDRVTSILGRLNVVRSRSLGRRALWIRPDVGHLNGFDFEAIPEILEAGYVAACEALDRLEAEARRPWYRKMTDAFTTPPAYPHDDDG